MKKKHTYLIIELSVVTVVFAFVLIWMVPRFMMAQNINSPEHFPDPNFRRAVEMFLEVEEGGHFSAFELRLKKDRFHCGGRGISSLQGIEYFTGIKHLDCSNNQLRSLDVSALTELETLHCEYNLIKQIDISNNTNLKSLECAFNQIEILDLSNNPNLGNLNCSWNQLTDLDLSNNPNLHTIISWNNQLTSIDLTNNANLKTIDFYSNRLDQVPAVDHIDSLKALDVRNNPLTKTDSEMFLLLRERLGDPLLYTPSRSYVSIQSGFAYSSGDEVQSATQ
jgi:hypothetical protein